MEQTRERVQFRKGGKESISLLQYLSYCLKFTMKRSAGRVIILIDIAYELFWSNRLSVTAQRFLIRRTNYSTSDVTFGSLAAAKTIL
jgi:hypothetical protein